MPETTGVAEAQAADATQPQAGTTPSGPVPGAQTGQVPSAAAEGGTGLDAAALARELEETRKSEARYRTENRRLAEAAKAAEDAKLSETDRLRKENEDLRKRDAERDAKDRERDLTAAIVAIATRLDFRDPDLASRLVDRSAVDIDDTGRPRNIEKLLRDIAKDRAYLLRGTPDLGGGNRGATPSGTDMDDFLRQAAGRGTQRGPT